jgi:small subunit ribosomal protein S1
VPLPYVYEVTKYEPTDWNEDGRYVGLEVETSDHGPKEAAYLAAVVAFAEESGVSEVGIREPAVADPVNFGLEASVDGHGLAELLAPDLSDYYDGAVLPISVAVEPTSRQA